MQTQENTSELILYQTADGVTKVEARLQDDNVWLTQSEISSVFGVERSVITKHIKKIFEVDEVDEKSNVQKMHIAISDKPVSIYSLDVILAVGYRTNSSQAIHFRKWATNILHEYIQKGFAMNDEQLKNLGRGVYWHELLDRIRDIRSSEKVFWRQVLDIFATSVDYDPKSDEAQHFFKKIQNKMHFAVHGNTAAEIVHNRADSAKDFMGLTIFSGVLPNKSEAIIAKNYLTEQELKDLNLVVSGYLDFAEGRARRHIPMHMSDWTSHVDSILAADGRELLQSAGTTSHTQAENKALDEYDKFKERVKSELTLAEKHFIENLKEVQQSLLK